MRKKRFYLSIMLILSVLMNSMAQQRYVSTVAGAPTSNPETKVGKLSETTFSAPMFLAVDKNDNIIVVERDLYKRGIYYDRNFNVRIKYVGKKSSSAVLLNEKEKTSTLLSPNGMDLCNTPTIYENKLYIAKDVGIDYITASTNDYKLMYENPLYRSELNKSNWKFSTVYNPADKLLYTIMWKGQLVSINPITKKVKIVSKNLDLPESKEGPGSLTYLAFNPKEENVFYYSTIGGSSIFRAELKNDTVEVKPYAGGIVDGKSGTSCDGYVNGSLKEARFNIPQQIAFDKNGVMYIADTKNHAIRTIDTTKDNPTVETLVGSPEKEGYKDGTVEEVELSLPMGVAVAENGDIYVADTKNYSIRKISTTKPTVITPEEQIIGRPYITVETKNSIGKEITFNFNNNTPSRTWIDWGDGTLTNDTKSTVKGKIIKVYPYDRIFNFHIESESLITSIDLSQFPNIYQLNFAGKTELSKLTIAENNKNLIFVDVSNTKIGKNNIETLISRLEPTKANDRMLVCKSEEGKKIDKQLAEQKGWVVLNGVDDIKPNMEMEVTIEKDCEFVIKAYKKLKYVDRKFNRDQCFVEVKYDNEINFEPYSYFSTDNIRGNYITYRQLEKGDEISIKVYGLGNEIDQLDIGDNKSHKGLVYNSVLFNNLDKEIKHINIYGVTKESCVANKMFESLPVSLTRSGLRVFSRDFAPHCNPEILKDKNWHPLLIGDGTANCSSSAVPLLQVKKQSSFTLFPNPAKNILTIQRQTGNNKEQKVQIIDNIGKLVYTTQIKSHQKTINLNLPLGIYLVKIGAETQKLIIE